MEEEDIATEDAAIGEKNVSWTGEFDDQKGNR